MLQRISEGLKSHLHQESLSARSERMLPAAMYGVLLATAYTLAGALVNVYSFPNLPLGFDWVHILGTWAGISAAFALAGIIAGWFSEEYNGIVAGGAIITALLAVVFLIQLGANNSALTMQSILMAVPLVGVCMLAAGALRWTARRHLQITRKDSAEIRPKRLAGHIFQILLVGLFLGILGRMDLPAETTLTQFHQLLQAASEDQSTWTQLPVKQVPALPEHFGQDYVFYVRPSEFALGSLDVTVQYADGFKMNCLFSIGGSNFFTDCYEDQ
jgi:uncharacterized membrane protein YidH (DUF202 family)